MTVLAGARVVTPAGVLHPGWVELRDGRIVRIGRGAPDEGAVTDLGGGWLLPGYIDLHVHGGHGHDFAASPDDLAEGVAFHRANGTTRMLISLSAAPLPQLREQLGWIAALVERGPHAGGHVVGAHLEGPFLSPTRCGAQNPAYLLTPDREMLAGLLEAGRGHVRVMTIAPELPGALELIDDLVAAKVVAAIGHTDASYEAATAGFRRGATLATHLYNGMRPMHHREPGPVLAALGAPAACEVINDGVHVHPAVLRLVLAHGADKLVLVSDAIAAAGLADDSYQLAGRDVVVKHGEARLADDGCLAGSTITMQDAVRRAVTVAGLPVAVAAAAAATNPARVLGIDNECGWMAAGLAADLVLLDDDYRVQRVMTSGDG